MWIIAALILTELIEIIGTFIFSIIELNSSEIKTYEQQVKSISNLKEKEHK